MTNILHITASIRDGESVSRDLSGRLVERLAAETGAEVVTRDVGANDLPYIDAARFAANNTGAADRTAEQQALAALADGLIAELQAADVIVFGVPIYNFGVPATVKSWADMVARAGTTFRYTEKGPVGLLDGKKAILVAVSGGTTVGSEIDFMSPWLKHFLGFLGITDIDVIAADGIMGFGGEEKIKKAREQVEQFSL